MSTPAYITVELLEKRAAEIGAENSEWYRDWPAGVPGHQLINREWHPVDLDTLFDGVDDDLRGLRLRNYSAQLFAIAVKAAHEASEP
jgi:hypothetical protein